MPRGQEHDPIYLHQYLRTLCWSIFFQVFLVNDCCGKKGHCSVFGCNNDCLFVQKALVNTEQVHPGHPIILLRFNKFNMAAVSVNRSIAYQQVVKI